MNTKSSALDQAGPGCLPERLLMQGGVRGNAATLQANAMRVSLLSAAAVSDQNLRPMLQPCAHIASLKLGELRHGSGAVQQ